jgi:murein DD-endopeptidase MepM/ murein hydrolase activator NlpD
MDKSQGGLSTIPGKYAYFAPTREEWGVILRDGGFSIIDPTVVEFSVTPELLQRRADPLTSGVLARIPIQTEISPTEASPLPVFMQVELMQDPDTTAHWISFSEFLRSRAIQSRPPGPVVPQFREWLDTLTAESDFESWKFRRGMFFGDRIEWWGNRNRRRTLHEGIDFAEGSRSDGSVRPVPAVPVRSIADGEIVSLLDDFLNKTVVVRHPGIRNEAGAMFYTFFSHIQPQTSRLGPVIRGEVLGEVHKAGSSGAPAHLHLTGAWVPECIHADEVTMDLISSTFMPLVLVNFNSLLVVSRTS